MNQVIIITDIKEDPLLQSENHNSESIKEPGPSSLSDFSLFSFSTATGAPKRPLLSQQRASTPEQNRELPSLELPKSSDDLLVPKHLALP